MSQPYKSGRQQNLNLGITSVTESRTVLQTIGKVGIGTTNAQNHSLFVVGTTNITGDIVVGGSSTFVGVGTFGSDLYVNNQLYAAGVNVSGGAIIGEDITTRNFLASGISTFTGSIDANGDFDVDGHTELDNVNISGFLTATSAFFSGNVSIAGTLTYEDVTNIDAIGIITARSGIDITGGGLTVIGVSTFTGAIDANGGATIDNIRIGVANDNTIDTSTGGLTLDSSSGTVTIDDQLIVSGISTFNIDVDVDRDLNVDRNLNVTGTSIFVGIVTNQTTIFGNQLSVSGVSTFIGIVTTGGDLFVGGDLYVKDDLVFDEFTARNAILTGNLSIVGVSTFTGSIDANGDLDVDGHTELDNVNISGVATFQSNAYFGDSDVLNFGDGNDLQIYHDGANSVVKDIGSGSLILQSDGIGVDIYNIVQGEYQARFKNNDAVELYHDSIKRLETTGYGITVYDTIQAPQLNITGIGTIDGITIASGIVTSSQPGVTTVKYYGDGSNLFGVNAFNVVNQVLSASPVYPTFANNTGVTSIGIADTQIGFIPTLGNLGIGSTNPTAKLQVIGDVLVSGVVTARQFVGDVNAGVATVGLATVTSIFVNSLTAGIATVNIIDVNQISPDGVDFGESQYILRATGSGTWEWADVPGIFSVNNILNGFNVSDEGSIVGTAGSITQIDFRGNNIIASANPQPNGIATVRVSDNPNFLTLNVSGVSTFAGITTISGDTLFANQLSVSGVSTFVGVGTFIGDLYVGGDLYINDDLIFDEFTARNATITGFSTLGITSATTLFVSGISTFNNIVNIGSAITAYPATGIISATAFYGDGSNLANTGSTLNAASGTQRLVLTSQTTGTMTQSSTISDLVYNSSTNTLSATNFAPAQLTVTGVSTFSGPISTGSTTGNSGQYLESTGIGVTWATFPTLRTTQTNVATNGQTSFSFYYNVNFLDVFVNGVKLTSSEYIANNGSTITLNSPAFANDIVEFVSYNTTSVGSGGSGASILDDLNDVNLSLPVAAGEVLVYNGVNWVNDYAATASTSTTSQTAIHTLSASTYRSVEYTIQATQGLKYHMTKLLAIHDGLIASNTEYGTIFTIDSLGAFDVDISGGNIRLLVTPAAVTTTNYKIKFNAFKV